MAEAHQMTAPEILKQLVDNARRAGNDFVGVTTEQGGEILALLDAPERLKEEIARLRNMYDELQSSQERNRADYEAQIKKLQDELEQSATVAVELHEQTEQLRGEAVSDHADEPMWYEPDYRPKEAVSNHPFGSDYRSEDRSFVAALDLHKERVSALAEDAEMWCERCGQRHGVVWFAPSDLWNAVMRPVRGKPDEFGFCCPLCFMQLAEERLGPVVFKVSQEIETSEQLRAERDELHHDLEAADERRRVLETDQAKWELMVKDLKAERQQAIDALRTIAWQPVNILEATDLARAALVQLGEQEQ